MSHVINCAVVDEIGIYRSARHIFIFTAVIYQIFLNLNRDLSVLYYLFRMPRRHQNGKNPYLVKNSELEEEIEAAVEQAMEDDTLPDINGANASGENGDHSDDGYSWTARVANLERQVFTLNDEMTSLREECRNGHFVIVAKDQLQIFEENLAMFIYPPGRMFGRAEIFPTLMNWLNLRRNTPQGVRANDRWLRVQHEVQWRRHHEDVLARLRNYLRPDITQPVETWNPVLLTEEDNTCIADLYRVSRRLSEWIEDEENEREVINAQ